MARTARFAALGLQGQLPLSPEKRAEVLVELGTQLRLQGTPESLAASAEALCSVVDGQGLEAKSGRAAAYQLIWPYAERKDPARGVAMARAYADSPTATPLQRIEGRWAAAIVRHGSGDVASARRDYEQLLRDMGAAQEFAKLAADIKQRLARL